MRMFAQSLSGEAKKWYKYLPAGSIRNLLAFQTTFWDRWDDKKIPFKISSQYNNLKREVLSQSMSFPIGS